MKVKEIKRFITDNGGGIELVSDAGDRVSLPRYAYWEVNARGKSEVIETSDDLDVLKEKYGEDLVVVEIK